MGPSSRSGSPGARITSGDPRLVTERDILAAARRHGIVVPEGVEALFARARRAGATLGSHGLGTIWADFGRARGRSAGQVLEAFARRGVLTDNQNIDAFWLWSWDAPLRDLPVLRGQQALDAFVRHCRMELPVYTALRYAVASGLSLTMGYRRVLLLSPKRLEVYAVLDGIVEAAHMRHWSGGDPEKAEPPYVDLLRQYNIIDSAPDAAGAWRNTCFVSEEPLP